MNAVLIAVLVVVVLVLIILLRSVRIVPQARAAVVERLGRYTRTQGPGVAILVPFVDRMRPLIDLREQVVSFPPQPVITSDNLTVAIDSVIYFQVTDPRAATYEIQNYIQAVEQLTITTLRNVVGALNLEETLTSRDQINTQLRGVLDEATGPWGIRVARVEIKAIDPPPSIQDAMEQQMRADRAKRAVILNAEGQRESAIQTAQGQKAAQILSAEGQKQSAILAAEADRQSRILRAEGERAARYLAAQGQAKAIETTFNAIHAAKPDPALLAYQYLQTLPQIAQGDANKMWIVPSEFSKALEGLARMSGGDGQDTASWLNVSSTGDTAAEPKIDTEGWFDSQLPPASSQPEASPLLSEDETSDGSEADGDATGSLAASRESIAERAEAAAHSQRAPRPLASQQPEQDRRQPTAEPPMQQSTPPAYLQQAPVGQQPPSQQYPQPPYPPAPQPGYSAPQHYGYPDQQQQPYPPGDGYPPG